MKRGTWMPLVFAVTWGAMIGWFGRLAAEHDVAEWVRIPAAYAAGFLIVRVTGWWLPRAWARAAEREERTSWHERRQP